MSPLKINMLLHYFCSPRDYRDEVPSQHATSPAVKEALASMQDDDLIHITNPGWARHDAYERKSEFSVTDKGRAMVNHLMAVEIPVCKWIQPERVPA